MLLRFEATLNGVAFSNLDPTIILRDIEEMPPNTESTTVKRAIHPGMRVTSQVRRALSLKLIFCVREYDISARSRVLDKIACWVGNGGWLTINSRPGQRLFVMLDRPPSLGSSLKWTGDMEMTLTAYDRPYWEQQWPTAVTITDIGNITPIGTHPDAYVECDVTNIGDGDLTGMEIICGGTKIRLEDLSVPSGEHVQIRYTDRDVLTITAAGKSALANRTDDSSDDLIAHTRQQNAVAISADQPVSAIVYARGRFL